MVTKAIVMSITKNGTRCVVRMPLFENASNTSPVTAEALVSITPGLFNNLFVNDVVFVAFEENALEKPIIIGKLYRGTSYENGTKGGAGILDTLTVRTSASIPAETTTFEFAKNKDEYKDLKTPKKMADYIKWLEKLFKSLITQLNDQLKCLKNWVQFQLQPENVEVDDGDIDVRTTSCGLYQEENAECLICGKKCHNKKKIRTYPTLDTTKKYPKI